MTFKRTHGMKGTSIYKRWSRMRWRCKYRPDYVGRGIRVCDRWQSFENFYADMGHPPPGLTLERINNDGDYCPENCRWATVQEQQRNRRTNHRLTFGGETKTIVEWADETGIRADILMDRINKHHWPVDRALTTPRRLQP